jgi:predicted DNA-binding transcriptional regulator AlpA
MNNVVLSTRNIDDFISDVANEVVKKIYFTNKIENQQPEIETPLDIKEVSKLIKKTVPTIYGYCQRNESPFSRKGNRLYFFRSAIVLWLKESKVKTVGEIEADASAYLLTKNKAM